MKKLVGLAAMVVMMGAIGRAANTYSSDPRFTDQKLKAIEMNLRLALEEGNYGVQASAAQVVRQVKGLVPRYEFSSLVTPLTRIAKGDYTQPEANRILATLALYDLVGDSIIEQPTIEPTQNR